MKIIENPERTELLINELTIIWENSVRKSHIFLSEDDIIKLIPFVRVALAEIDNLLLSSSEKGIAGFMGIYENKIEMLFLSPEYFGKGIGKSLVVDAINRYNINKVDVNEQNSDAVGFYKHLGFETIERTQIDEQGNPFPILKMKMERNGLLAWEKNAEFWDECMGDESNFFHCDIVRPGVEKLLDIKKGDFVLDIACGNGNFSARIAQQGVSVVAFDYSPKMIELAKKRREEYFDYIDFMVCDATNYNQLIELKRDKPFNKAVANMAIMDIEDIDPLFKAVSDVLCDNGIFVFATHHPCFTYPQSDYFTSSIDKGVAIEGQPLLQNYYHRSIGKIFNIAFKNGFVLDGFFEVPFEGDKTPIVMIVRLRKL